MGFLLTQKEKLTQAALQNEKIGFLREKVWPETEKFLIAGPSLIGFIIGLWRYAPGVQHFETAFQSLVIFSLYMLALVVMQTLDSLFLSSWPIVLGVARSVFALAYIAFTVKQYLEMRSGAVRFNAITVRLRSRLNAAIGKASS